MSRKDRWVISALPGVLRAHVKECNLLLDRVREARQALGDTPERRRVESLITLEAQWAANPALPLFWVTEPMAQVALDASQDIPTVTPAIAPCPAGFLAVAGGLPPLPVEPSAERTDTQGQPITEPIAPSAVLWFTSEAGFHVCVYAHTTAMPAGRRISRSGPLHELVEMTLPRTPDGGWPEALDGDALHLGLLAWLGACWHLMMTPTVAERTQIDPRTGGPAQARTSGPSQGRAEPEITYVDLRPMREIITDPTEETTPAGRTYQHRWIVRGHWTHQPYGKGQAHRRLHWRESYVKGPAGAPLKRSRPVNVWRR